MNKKLTVSDKNIITMTDNMASTSVGTDEMLVPAEEVSTPAQGAEITEEERLRQEAAKRLERRKRKMMSPEERLAMITGRPVEPVSPVSEVVSSGVTIPALQVMLPLQLFPHQLLWRMIHH